MSNVDRVSGAAAPGSLSLPPAHAPSAPAAAPAPSMPTADRPAPPPAVSARPQIEAPEVVQGPALALARVLGRVVAALDLLTQSGASPSASAPFPATLPAGGLSSAREEILLARAELAPMLGAGMAQLSPPGRNAQAQRRADPAHSPHFGG